MKKLIVLIMLLLALAIPVQATGELLVDDADVLTEQEEERISGKLKDAAEQCGLDIVIVTVDGIGDTDIETYADDYYDYNGYADDGVLLLVDMDQRKWWITGTGDGVDIFRSSVIDDIGDMIELDMRDDNYTAAFETFIAQCIYYVEDPFDITGSLIVALVVGVVVALIVTLIWRGQLKSVRFKTAAGEYVRPGSLAITGSHELYLYSTVSRVRRQQNTSGGVHTGSSGRTHSGGGGRF